jgi:hypothetical protein
MCMSGSRRQVEFSFHEPRVSLADREQMQSGTVF